MTGRNNAAMARVKWPCVGPLASHIDGFAGHLAGEGYAPSTIHEKYGFLADLSSWLEARQIALDTLDEGQLNQFHATRRSRGRARRGDAPTALQLLRYLRDLYSDGTAGDRPDPSG